MALTIVVQVSGGQPKGPAPSHGAWARSPLSSGRPLFGCSVPYAAGSRPDSVAIADLNGDGRPDLVTADFVGMVSVLLGNGDGTFQPQHAYPAGNDTASVAVGDLNGDGRTSSPRTSQTTR